MLNFVLSSFGGYSYSAAHPQNTNLIIITVLCAFVLLSAAVMFIANRFPQSYGFLRGIFSSLKVNISALIKQSKDSLSSPIAGFVYDKNQDIFYSDMNAWQRKFGYCRLYDEISPSMSMIVDSEPVYFEYGGKRWLVEFWKGQYGMTTGCEAGVYTTRGPGLSIPGVFHGAFYDCADDADMLYISYVLIKNGRVLFRRSAKHWWLTGFVLGEFSQPSELEARMTIALKDVSMRKAFLKGLKEAGYSDSEINVSGKVVRFIFGSPHSKQPFSRTKELEGFMQKKNEVFCSAFNALTTGINGAPAKLEAVLHQDPVMYKSIIDFWESKYFLQKYKKLSIQPPSKTGVKRWHF